MPALRAREQARQMLDEAQAGKIRLSAEGWFGIAIAAGCGQDHAERLAHDALLRGFESDG